MDLDQLQRTIRDVHTLTQQLAAVQAKALASLIPAAAPSWPGTAPRGLAGDIDPHPAGGMLAGGSHRPRAA